MEPPIRGLLNSGATTNKPYVGRQELYWATRSLHVLKTRTIRKKMRLLNWIYSLRKVLRKFNLKNEKQSLVSWKIESPPF